jgi:hypothetical protein
MSRGLGKLQREVKAIVAEYDAWFFGEYVFLAQEAGEPVDSAPWLTWRIIRNRYFQERGFDFSVTGRTYVHASLERGLKRALKRLVDRGEVCRVPMEFGWHYTTPETFKTYEAALPTASPNPVP